MRTNVCYGGGTFNRKRIIPVFVMTLTIFIMLISIGYAALNQNLNISGEAFLRAKDNIRISRVELSDAKDEGYETYSPEYSKRTTKMYTTLPKDTSSVTYTVKVTNSTGIKYKVDSIDVTTTNSNVSCIPSIEVNSVLEDGITEFTVIESYKSEMSADTNLDVCNIKYAFSPFDATPPTLTVQLVKDNGNTKIIKIVAEDDIEGSGLSQENVYKYYLSTSNTALKDGEWKDYTNNVEFEIEGDFEVKYLWVYPVKDKVGNISDNKESINTAYLIESYSFIDNSPTLYNVLAKEASSGSGLAKLYTGKHNDTYNEIGTRKIYYFYGSTDEQATKILNGNNVLFAGFCWQMIRTTDTGGVKMLYNGTYKTVQEKRLLDEDEYVDLPDGHHAYVYDSETKKWEYLYGVPQGSFKMYLRVTIPGEYFFTAELSTKKNMNHSFAINKNGSLTESFSFPSSGVKTINLGYLNTDDYLTIFENAMPRSGSDGAPSYDDAVTSSAFYLELVTKNEITCENNEAEKQIGTSAFNTDYDSPAYAGYMYNKTYSSNSKSLSSADVYKYSNSFVYLNGTYKLSDDAVSINVTNSTEKARLNNAHYTCFNTSGECKTIYYIYYLNGTYANYIKLENGVSIEEALEEMLSADNVNQTNSIIKDTIDTWYANNMTSYTKYLEDTVFCNDRSISNYGGWNPNGGSITQWLNFNNYNDLDNLYCTNITDRFSVENSKAKLTYPVGLMSAPEMNLLNATYLLVGRNHWLFSPRGFNASSVTQRINIPGRDYTRVDNPYGVRPSVSLAPSTQYSSGTGSVTDPYIVKTS